MSAPTPTNLTKLKALHNEVEEFIKDKVDAETIRSKTKEALQGLRDKVTVFNTKISAIKSQPGKTEEELRLESAIITLLDGADILIDSAIRYKGLKRSPTGLPTASEEDKVKKIKRGLAKLQHDITEKELLSDPKNIGVLEMQINLVSIELASMIAKAETDDKQRFKQKIEILATQLSKVKEEIVTKRLAANAALPPKEQLENLRTELLNFIEGTRLKGKSKRELEEIRIQFNAFDHWRKVIEDNPKLKDDEKVVLKAIEDHIQYHLRIVDASIRHQDKYLSKYRSQEAIPLLKELDIIEKAKNRLAELRNFGEQVKINKADTISDDDFKKLLRYIDVFDAQLSSKITAAKEKEELKSQLTLIQDELRSFKDHFNRRIDAIENIKEHLKEKGGRDTRRAELFQRYKNAPPFELASKRAGLVVRGHQLLTDAEAMYLMAKQEQYDILREAGIGKGDITDHVKNAKEYPAKAKRTLKSLGNSAFVITNSLGRTGTRVLSLALFWPGVLFCKGTSVFGKFSDRLFGYPFTYLDTLRQKCWEKGGLGWGAAGTAVGALQLISGLIRLPFWAMSKLDPDYLAKNHGEYYGFIVGFLGTALLIAGAFALGIPLAMTAVGVTTAAIIGGIGLINVLYKHFYPKVVNEPLTADQEVQLIEWQNDNKWDPEVVNTKKEEYLTKYGEYFGLDVKKTKEEADDSENLGKKMDEALSSSWEKDVLLTVDGKDHEEKRRVESGATPSPGSEASVISTADVKEKAEPGQKKEKVGNYFILSDLTPEKPSSDEDKLAKDVATPHAAPPL